MNLRHIPFLRLFLPWAAGIVTGTCLTYPVPGLGWVLLASGLALFCTVGKKFQYRFRWAYGILLVSVLFGTGYWHAVTFDERQQANHFSRVCSNASVICGTVYDAPVRGAKWKVPLRLVAAGPSADSLRPCSGNVLVLLDTTPEAARVRYGDRLLVAAPVRLVPPPRNPCAFDYQQYLHFKNIHFQAFGKPGSYYRISSGHGNPVWRTAMYWRDYLLTVLQKNFPGKDEFAVAAALLLGYKEALSDELRASYADTGAMHILAVSGTHVGLLYLGLFLFLNRIPWRGRLRRWGEVALVLAGIWAFTLVTGATASVMRASVMFTAYVLSKAIRRQASIWNILGASAFGLLLFNPYFLFDTGFQLSYSAVAGIVFFYPMFRKITPTLPKWAAEGWNILLIGVAAQLGTLPLSLYYFHQFPVYFWLAGWVVVLGGAVFLWGGFLLILLHGLLPEIASGLGWALYHWIWGMNQAIRAIQQLPGSVWSGIWIEGWMAGCLCIFIYLFAGSFSGRHARGMLASFVLLVVLAGGYATQTIRSIRQKQITLYHANRRFVLDLFAGEKRFTLRDSLDGRQEQFATQGYRWASGIRQAEHLTFQSGNSALFWSKPFLQFYQKKLLVLDRDFQFSDWAGPPLPVDVLILHGSPGIELEACLRQFPCHLVVFSASNSRYRVERWKAVCRTRRLAFYDVGERGAWQLAFP